MRPGIRVALAILLVSLFLLMAIPQEASAFPFKLEGYLTDIDGNPIPQGRIFVTGMVYDVVEQDFISASVNVTTDSLGYYRFDMGVSEPGGFDAGSTVTVSYHTGEADEASTTIILDGFSGWADLTYEKKQSFVDIIVSPVGLVILVALVSIAFIGYQSYKTSDEDENGPAAKEPKQPVERRRK